MSFSGNSTVPAFSLGFSDLYGLVYDLDGGPLGDGLSLAIEGIGAAGGNHSYAVGPGPFNLCGQGIDCARVSEGDIYDYSQELVQVTVPALEPVPLSREMLIILALLLAGVGWRYVKE